MLIALIVSVVINLFLLVGYLAARRHARKCVTLKEQIRCLALSRLQDVGRAFNKVPDAKTVIARHNACVATVAAFNKAGDDIANAV